MKVLMLGRLRDAAGWREKSVPAAPSITALIAALSADPQLGEALAGRGVQVAVNKMLVRGDHALAEADEVAFLPPMSGG